MRLNEKNILRLDSDEIRKLVVQIVKRLEELDKDDFFGTEGWEHFFGLGE